MTFLFEDEPSSRKTREECLAETPEEVRAKVAGLLGAPDLLRWITEGIELLGVAGERLLSLTLYLVGTSRLLERPLAVIVQGASSSGKSYVIEKIARLFPPEEVLMASDITPNALYYLHAGALEHRLIVAGERPRENDQAGQGTKALREMISAGELSKLITISDVDGPRTELIEQRGPIAYMESTTAREVFEEDANRCLVLQPDERPEQTRRILAAAGCRLTGRATEEQRDQRRQEFHCLQRLLAPAEVVIRFGDRLGELFPAEPLEVRRAFTHVTSMVQCSALLHGFQRERDDQGRIVAQAEDYWLARMLLSGVLAQSLGGKSTDALKDFVVRLRKHPGEHTAKDLAREMNMNDRRVREHLQTLLEQGVIEQSSPARGPIPATWLIGDDIELREPDRSPLPTVEAVCGVDEDRLALSEMPADWASANLSGVPF